MDHHSVAYVGFDTSKTKHAVAVAEGGREGEVRYLGAIEAAPAAVERLLRKLAHRYKTLHVCYEAGPTGHGLYRHIRALGYACDVIAPSLVPMRPGDRVKTNRRDAVTLARLVRAGELTPVWVPDEVHEAVRDLVRARDAAARDLRHKRQQVLSFLLRHGRIFTGYRHWSRAHLRWLAGQAFDHPAQQIVLQDQVDAVADAQARLERRDRQLAELVPTWSMAPVVAACQAMRGVSFLVAVTFVAEIGDVRRFESPRQLMGFLTIKQACTAYPTDAAQPRLTEQKGEEQSIRGAFNRGLLRAGALRALDGRHSSAWRSDAGRQPRVRRALVEVAWSYRHPARVTERIRVRLENLPKAVREIAWKAQVRLSARYRRLIAAGKKAPVAVAAIAREMAAFLWAIGRVVKPA